jgi:hypothetical protein
VSPEIENAKKIMEALSEFGFEKVGLKEEDFSKPGRIIQLGYEPIRIDMVTSIDGCSFEEVWGKREQGIYGKEKVPFIGLNELIKNKKAAMRKQDEVDLDILIKAKKRRKH